MARKRSPHPGVVLIPPGHGHATWRARYVEPDSGRTVKVRLDGEALRNDRERRDWAIRKARALAKRRMDLEAGAPRETGSSVADALATYYADHPQLGARTVARYRAATDQFVAWCGRNGIASCDDITGPRLVAFRGALAKAPRRDVARKGKRGARVESDRRRSPDTINGELRAVGTVLGYLRRLGMLPKLGGDALGDALRKLPAAPREVTFLTTAEIGDLMRACEEHDAERFAETRDEHARKSAPGSTPRYRAVAPLVRGALLTGARFGALVALRWRDVTEHEIRPPGATPTKRGGTVDVALAGEGFATWLSDNRGAPTESVFGFTRSEANAALRRLVADYDAPRKATWQCMRRTAGCYLTCAPSIFGASSAYRAARWLGHSVQVAERHYLGVVRGIPPEARTLENALGFAPVRAEG